MGNVIFKTFQEMISIENGQGAFVPVDRIRVLETRKDGSALVLIMSKDGNTIFDHAVVFRSSFFPGGWGYTRIFTNRIYPDPK